jgi:branched-chain amino acid transport system permease protein
MSRIAKIALGVLVLLLIAFPLLVNPYTVQVAITTITYSMLGLAFAFSMRVGLPRMDIGAWWGVGGYTTALLMKTGMSFWLTALIGGIIAVILGFLLFSIALPRGMMAFFIFCMVLSMAFYQMFGSVPLFGGWGGILDVPAPTIGSFTFINKPELYYMGLFFLALTLVVYYLLYNSKIGRAWAAISSSLKLARSVGIGVVRYRMANVLIGNFFIALAGSFFVAYYRAAMPTIFSFQAGIIVMVYLIIGGFMHFLTGPILGALIATFIPEFVSKFKGYIEYQSIAIAVVVVLILMFLPLGILGWVDQRVKPWLYRRKWYWRISRWGVKEEREIPA